MEDGPTIIPFMAGVSPKRMADGTKWITHENQTTGVTAFSMGPSCVPEDGAYLQRFDWTTEASWDPGDSITVSLVETGPSGRTEAALTELIDLICGDPLTMVHPGEGDPIVQEDVMSVSQCMAYPQFVNQESAPTANAIGPIVVPEPRGFLLAMLGFAGLAIGMRRSQSERVKYDSRLHRLL